MSTFATYLNDYLDKRALREEAELEYVKKKRKASYITKRIRCT